MAERVFGEIDGFPEGSVFTTRLDLSFSKVHRPLQAGISGSQNEGADSIVVSGGYVDDEDYGDVIIYTGHGGRDISSGKQVADQVLVRGNKALALNCLSGLPVRVIRGRHTSSIFAPDEGYRYDGLFQVEEYWKEIGTNGFNIWRFRLRKISPEIKLQSQILQEDPEEYKSTKRIETNIQRIVRDTKLSKEIKNLYQNSCQICNITLETSSGPYSEAAHIKPLGVPHNGPDSLSNLLCLCPNHHVMFDFGGFSILENFELVGIAGELTVNSKHKINPEFLKYHFDHFYDEKNRF
ncbi:YDG/SRA domain-containing protein [Leeuwenhoekiella sp. A16]|uniref:YDG/SRA domain-containing protein n=1 Tax=unclassified Leeuwenhoekiella TaxID=2615029 RepID=UPI003A7FACE8